MKKLFLSKSTIFSAIFTIALLFLSAHQVLASTPDSADLISLSSPSVVTLASSSDLMINPGFETAGDNESRAYGWQDFNNGYTRSDTFRTGNWGIKLENSSNSGLSGAYQRIDLNQTVLKPVSLSGYVKGEDIVKAPSSWFGASLYAEIYLQNGKVVYWNSMPNTGTFDWRWVALNTGTLTGVNQPIKSIYFIPILGNAAGTAYFDDLNIKEITPYQSAVTIMIDDGEISTYTVGKKTLDQYKLPGVSAVATGLVGDTGYMTWAQIKNLYNSGWEIVSHSVSHEDMTNMSSAQITEELSGSKTAIAAQGIDVNNFALPYGAYNDQIMSESGKYYHSARPYEIGFNPQGVAPFEIKVQSATSRTTVRNVQSWLTTARTQKTWLIIVFHTLAKNSGDIYHTQPMVFASMVKAIAQSGMPVITYEQGLSRFSASQ